MSGRYLRHHPHQTGLELKTGKAALRKEGIDRLGTASEPTHLGFHARRLLITDRSPNQKARALAQARGFRVIPLTGWVGAAQGQLRDHASAATACGNTALRRATGRGMGLAESRSLTDGRCLRKAGPFSRDRWHAVV